ncbi:WD40 repeat, conserved site [Phytophthora cactorum]|nr:WD40 repeat, conserved site [Phytophthora cactorum]
MDTEFNAAISARECDTLTDENVTPLPASQSHVVFVSFPNVVILCKLFRRHGKHHDWAFHVATEERSNVVVRSAVTASLVETMQIFLLDLIPEIKIPNRNPLSSVAGICAALSCNEFLGIERHFPSGGLSKVDFTRLLLWELMRARPSLMQHLGRATALVGLLFEMFEQIDINGDSIVDWDEFTSFCIALGLVATRVPHDENDHDQGQSHGDNHDAPPRNMIVYRHEPLKKKAGEKQQDVLDSLEVLDAEHIPSRNALAVASSDLCISLWSIIDATVGSYVFNGKLAGRFPALFVKWCPPPLKRLFVAGGSTEQVQLWDLEVPMHAGAAPPPPPMLLPRSHTERIAACLDLPETPYVATASFDHTITIWETVAGANSALGGPSAVLTVSFVLRGHQQAVLTLDSAHNLLLSSGFEYQAYCWGFLAEFLRQNLEVITTASWGLNSCQPLQLDLVLQSRVIKVDILSFGTSLDVQKDFLGTIYRGTIGPESQHDEPGAQSTESPACDIVTGNLRLYRFSAFMQSVGSQEDSAVDESAGSAPTRFIVFNAMANTFVGAVENRITVWNANSGQKLRNQCQFETRKSVLSRSIRLVKENFSWRQTSTTAGSHSLYVGVETGQIFTWDLRSFPVKTQSEPDRRSAIRRRSSISKGKMPVLESVARDKSAPMPVVLSTKSWMAHQAGVLSVQSVPRPGELLSLGADGVVKIWDHTAVCVGHILTTAEQSSASASAWKFIRRDHTLGGDQKEIYERIAREVIAKHQRRLKKELSRQRKTGHQPQNEQPVPENSLATASSLLELDSPLKLPLRLQISGDSRFPDASTAMTNAANALVTQVPFSVTSVTSGIHQGIFGPEEAQHLRSIAKNSKALLLDVSDKRKRVAALAPLFSSPEEMGRARAKAKAKARAMLNNSPQTLDFPSRALTNYPLELERRAAANAKASASALRALDPEPSQFLREKLQDAASPIGKFVKSIPKKRLQRLPIDTPEIDIKMNASVVILARNVSLPKLTQFITGQEPDEPSHMLSSSASAPILPGAATEPPSSPEKKNRSSNIERKLKLCQKIVANVCLMSSKPKVSKEHSEKEKPDSPASNMLPASFN